MTRVLSSNLGNNKMFWTKVGLMKKVPGSKLTNIVIFTFIVVVVFVVVVFLFTTTSALNFFFVVGAGDDVVDDVTDDFGLADDFAWVDVVEDDFEKSVTEMEANRPEVEAIVGGDLD